MYFTFKTFQKRLGTHFRNTCNNEIFLHIFPFFRSPTSSKLAINCLLSDMSTSQLTENDLVRTSSTSDPDWDVFELDADCDEDGNGGGGGGFDRNSDGKSNCIC